jgi:hypothetical protein
MAEDREQGRRERQGQRQGEPMHSIVTILALFAGSLRILSPGN